MTDPAGVLLADDTLIAREGWRSILDTAGQFRVVGEVRVIEDLAPKVRELSPDLVLLDLKWDFDNRAGLQAIPQLKRELSAVKLIAVSAHPGLLAEARLSGADAALSKSFTRDQLLDVIGAVLSEHPVTDLWAVRWLQESRRFAVRLRKLEPGRRHARQYEELMEDTLPFLFEGHLSDFEFQVRHEEGEEIWDGIAFNSSAAPFWSTIRQEHGAGQILFEIKNVQSLKSEHVHQVRGYLSDPHVRFALIVTRNAPTTGASRAARRSLERDGLVVLILGDDDILEMLRVKADGGDPSDCLRRAYLAFTRRS